MPFLNLGILAHVDAGKTSLTERLLYDTGARAELGAVDSGTTQTDSMALEQQRGITIRANVAAFRRGDVQVNLIDTPGHADFIAEVERSLSVLDAAVVVVSAVEGVQPQTVVLWRALRRLRVPTMLFINKIDRCGSDTDRVLAAVVARLARPHGVDVLPRTIVGREGCPGATAVPLPWSSDLSIDVLTRHDDQLLAHVVHGRPVSRRRLRAAARTLIGAGLVVPVFAGSALTGAGVCDLIDGVTDLLPRARAASTSSALVFKVDTSDGVRRGWLRIFGGQLQVRNTIDVPGRRSQRITSLRAITPAGIVPVARAGAGEVVVWEGTGGLAVGDWIGATIPGRATREFASPALESVIEPVRPQQRGALHQALTALADADPLIGLRLDRDHGESAVTLYGEVQREVIAALVEQDYGVAVQFRPATIRHIERVRGTGEATATIDDAHFPYLAGLGVRVALAAPGTGIARSLEVELGSMPPALFNATWEGVERGLAQGRHGWPIPDAVVTITHTGYYPRQSHAHQKFNKAMSSVATDFRNLAPALIHSALEQAGTVVCEPVELFTLEVPATASVAAMAELARAQGHTTDSLVVGDSLQLTGHLPTRCVPDLRRALPDATQGEGVLVCETDHFRPVSVLEPPTRRRVGADPLDRVTWFRENPR